MKTLFKGIYKDKKVLITGHNGFKGSWLAFWLVQMGADVYGFSKKNYENSDHFERLNLPCQNFYGDIGSYEDVNTVFQSVSPDIVFHLAAQPLVRASYKSPVYTYQTNVMGTMNVLEAARQSNTVKAVVNITTDKVYENLESLHNYQETDKLGGHDPYSSSKACSEILTSSYKRSFLLNDDDYLLASVRAGNVVGGGDWSEDRLIPDIFRSVQNRSKLIIRNPEAVRPWQHVLEPLSAYLELGRQLLIGQKTFASAWNIGPQKEDCISVQDILNQIIATTPQDLHPNIESPTAQQPHEAKLLMLDIEKIKTALKWKPIWSINITIKKTADWYLDFIEKGKLATEKDLNDYITDAKKLELDWAL